MKKIKKFLKYALFITVLITFIIIFPICSYRKEANINPMPSKMYKGVYHLHSVYSDGKGTVKDIMKAASDLEYNFVILTDHGEPNRESLNSTAWFKNTLLIGGSEFSINAGHLAAFGFKEKSFPVAPEPQEAIDEVNADKGVTFIAHPYDDKIPWTDWNVKNFSGTELLNMYTAARNISFLKFITVPVQYVFNTGYALTSTLYYPEKNINKWSEFNKKGKYFGIFAQDAHGKLSLKEDSFSLGFPSYKSMFEILTVYVKTDKTLTSSSKDSAAFITSALRRGKFFNTVESLAPANGFRISLFNADKEEISEFTGSSEETGGFIVLDLPFTFKTDVIIYRDSKIVKNIKGNYKKKLEYKISEKGVYRAEIYITDNAFSKIPWIITNPFFIREEIKKDPEELHKPDVLLIKEEGDLKTEKSSDSAAELKSINEEDTLISEFSFKLRKNPSEKDFSAVLALRKNMNFENKRGISLMARSAEKSYRIWIEIRTLNPADKKENWYRHSMLVTKEWKRFNIEFSSFHNHINKAPEFKHIDLKNISSFFISVDNAIAYDKTEGKLMVKEAGLY